MINNCPRLTYSAIADNPEGRQSVKATFLMRKTSKKGGAKRLYLRGRLQNARTQHTLKVVDFHL